jgi:hypothetical protein
MLLSLEYGTQNLINIKCNLGWLDRVLRSGIGLLMVYLGFINGALITDAIAGVALGVFGAIILSSAIVCNCPLYKLVGFNTCRTAKKD